MIGFVRVWMETKILTALCRTTHHHPPKPLLVVHDVKILTRAETMIVAEVFAELEVL